MFILINKYKLIKHNILINILLLTNIKIIDPTIERLKILKANININLYITNIYIKNKNLF